MAATLVNNWRCANRRLVVLLAMSALKIISLPCVGSLSGAICYTYQAIYQSTVSPLQISIPLSPTGTSARFNLKSGRDVNIDLLTNNTFNPPPFTNYEICFGGSNNTKSMIRTAGHGAQATTIYNTSSGAILNNKTYVSTWISWANGRLQAGLGKVVGSNRTLNYFDPSPTKINFMLIQDFGATGDLIVTYCFDEYYYDQKIPVDALILVADMTLTQCGRTCIDDPNCQGYAVGRDVSPVESTSCSLFYTISGFIFDQQHVSYVIRNATYFKP